METLAQLSPAIQSADSVASERLLTEGLDFYKPTMSQVAYRQEPDAEVTFSFHNRGSQRLLDYINPDNLQAKLDALRQKGWTKPELQFLGSLTINDSEPAFSSDFLDYLGHSQLPEVTIGYDAEIDDLSIETKGDWPLVTFWETVVMGEVNEAYFETYLQAHNINPADVYKEGDRRLSQKIAILQAHPDIKFADFGTRRHFSAKWQEHVVGRLVAECAGNLVGTSNVALAQKFGIAPIGTFAHEMPMVYAGLAHARGGNVRASHNRMLIDWYEQYGAAYSVALTDTFKTDFFFSDFTPTQAEQWRGVRQDSGDPYAFGEKLLSFYEQHGVDPTTKTVVFSDGLDIDQIVALHKHFAGRINVLFGWGTTLTNDMGIKPLNVVMKATHVRDKLTGQEADNVKIGDGQGKRTGPPELVNLYEHDPHYFALAA